MNNVYQKVFDEFCKAIKKQGEMVVWIAKRTLSVKDFTEFIDEFAEKPKGHEEILDFVKRGEKQE